jgi:hypothetical protein
MTLTEAERIVAKQAKDRTPEEQAALLEKTRQLNRSYKQNERKRKKDMRDVQSEGMMNSASKNQMTFVAMKVSDCEKIIEPQLMKIYDASLKGLLMTKPNVVRGSMRNGLEEQ